MVSAEKGEFKWTNDAGHSWNLTLDRKEGVLRTGPDNPYYKENPDSRVLQPVFATSPRPGQRTDA